MAYDQATQWLLDQMHDPNLPLHRRIDIAKFLIESRPEEFKGQRRSYTTIVIEGPTPNTPVTITFTLPGQSPFELGYGYSVEGMSNGIARVTIVGADTDHIVEDHSPARLN
jgi:hypothetical protein